MLKPSRQKRCKACCELFQPFTTTQVACSPECALRLARATPEKTRIKHERRALKERKNAIKTRSQWLKEVQAIFNSWVRERDKELPCISCQRFHAGSYDAGHYRSVGSNPALRFEPLNVWKQCVPCNQHRSGNSIEFRINLVKRIGIERVEWLEGPHEPKKYTIDDLKALKAEYQQKRRELVNGKTSDH